MIYVPKYYYFWRSRTFVPNFKFQKLFHMKKFLLSASLCYAFTTLSLTQITVTSASFPALGDTLYVAVDNAPSAAISISAAGPNQTWDYSSLGGHFVRRSIVASPGASRGGANFADADFAIAQAGEVSIFYKSTPNALIAQGLFAADPLGLGLGGVVKVTYNDRVVPMNYPSSKNYQYSTTNVTDAAVVATTIGGIFEGLDSIRAITDIDRTDAVDAWGKIKTPAGTFDVLREKRTEIRNLRIEVKTDEMPEWQDVTLLFEGTDLVGVDTAVSYRFYNNTAKEVIAFVSLKEDGSVDRVEYKASKTAIPSSNRAVLAPEGNVTAYPNPVSKTVNFEFADLPSGNYTLTIYSAAGSEVFRNNYFILGTTTQLVNVSSYETGTYVYSLRNAAGNVVATKQFVIAR